MEPSPLKLKPSWEPKRRKVVIDFRKCIICQKEDEQKSRKASPQGLTTFLRVLKTRNDAGHNIQYERLEALIRINNDDEFEFIEPVPTFLWHKNCYSSFTSITNLSTLQLSGDTEDQPSTSKGNVRARESFKLKELCMFCGKKSYKRDRMLVRVATFEFGSTLKRRVEEKNDMEMKARVGGDFTKLIALEARYHKACHSGYIKKSKECPERPENAHKDAFDELVKIIQPELVKGKALSMDTLLTRYHELLKQYLPEDEAEKYTRQRLKKKLETQCSNLVQIHHVGLNKPDLVLPKCLQIQDVINTVAEMKEMLAAANISVNSDDNLTSPRVILFHAAMLLRSAIRSHEGISILPLNPADISEENEEKLVTNDAYTFLHWILAGNPPESLQPIDKDQVKHQDEALHRHTLSLGQDLVYMASSGSCRTPKHVGLGVSLHQITQSADVVRLVNKQGNCIGYDEVLRIDTRWANDQLNRDISVPTNMIRGKVTRAAGDNFNRATESLSGAHHDVVNMVLYQIVNDNDDEAMGHFGDIPQHSRSRSRSLPDIDGHKTILQCPNIGGKQPHPRHLLGQVKTEWFLTCSAEHTSMRELDRELATNAIEVL